MSVGERSPLEQRLVFRLLVFRLDVGDRLERQANKSLERRMKIFASFRSYLPPLNWVVILTIAKHLDQPESDLY